MPKRVAAAGLDHGEQHEQRDAEAEGGEDG
jgi:hypothetical protein